MNLGNSAWTWAAWIQFCQVTIVAFAVLFVVRAGCRRRPHLAHLLWLLVILKCLTPPLWSTPTGIFSWIPISMLPVPASSTLPPVDAAFFEGETVAGMRGPEQVLANATTHIPTAPVNSPAPSSMSAPFVLGLIWLAGSLVLASVVWVKWLGIRRVIRDAVALDDPVIVAFTDDLARKLGLRRRVRVLVTAGPVGPASLSLFKPTVLMPAELLRGNKPEHLELILAHELIHIRRGDLLIGIVQLVAQVIWWFHPLIWWANRETSRECERCCDEEVVASLGCSPATYARCLLDLVALKQLLRPAFALRGMRPGQVTAQRLETIMKRTAQFHARTPRWCWALFLAAAALILPGREWVMGEPGAPSEALTEEVPPVFQDSEANSFRVFPVTTELQHSILTPVNGCRAKAYVHINIDAVIDEKGVLDEKALNLKAIQQALAPYQDKEKSCVYFGLVFCTEKIDPLGPIGDRLSSELTKKLNEFGRTAGFRAVQVTNTYKGWSKGMIDRDWEQTIARIKEAMEDKPEADEPANGNDLVRVYPVRTTLSRILTNNVDCCVSILPPFDFSRSDVLKPEIQDAMILYVSKTRVVNKNIVQISYKFEGKWEKSEADKMNNYLQGEAPKWLGFKNVNIQVSRVGR